MGMTTIHSKRRTTTIIAVTLFALLTTGCNRVESVPPTPIELTRETACSLDGMLLLDYPGPKAQIHYAQGPVDFFCDTVEMFSIYLRPEQQKRIRALYVQDMGRTDWNSPQGQWIDAKTAYYVHGGKLLGSMGPTLASFAYEAQARDFIAKHGGKLYGFNEITPEMAALDGGALHDHKM